MKKIISMLITILIILLCGCGDYESPDATEPESSTAEESTEESTEETEQELNGNSGDPYTDGVYWDVAGGFNFIKSAEYTGEDVIMNIKVNVCGAAANDMAVYLNVQGLFLPFTMQEYTDESFETALSEESKADDFHQLRFSAEDCISERERYYTVKFRPDMFSEGSIVYPDIVCNVNNTYMPSDSGGVNVLASSAFGIYPPALSINAAASQSFESCKSYDVIPMTPEDADSNDNENIKAEILQPGEKYEKNFIKVSENGSIALRARIHNFYDEYLKCDTKQAVVSVLVNDRPYAAFDGCKCLEISVDKNNFYTYDFTLDTDSLNSMNKVQLYVCQLEGTQENPYNVILTSNPVYIASGS